MLQKLLLTTPKTPLNPEKVVSEILLYTKTLPKANILTHYSKPSPHTAHIDDTKSLQNCFKHFFASTNYITGLNKVAYPTPSKSFSFTGA
jgi:hypothetical protein